MLSIRVSPSNGPQDHWKEAWGSSAGPSMFSVAFAWGFSLFIVLFSLKHKAPGGVFFPPSVALRLLTKSTVLWVIDAVKTYEPQLCAPSARSDVRCDAYKQSPPESQ
ncbi:hypothetical protein EYF80_015874 [Liparis tanakae]|uniref:Uncharacterized protein n=1 Tax=Liparis tanakae TaxID=230148 RepID=A0A4Z2I736_9TELE|nr:hypothetical protein EYF80_015874 [Liparis tanakae]